MEKAYSKIEDKEDKEHLAKDLIKSLKSALNDREMDLMQEKATNNKANDKIGNS